MDENKKYIIPGYLIIGGLTLFSFGLGYSLGTLKKVKIRNNIYTLGIPSEFTVDECKYYIDEIMKQLKTRTAINGEVSDEEYKNIVVDTYRKTKESKNMVNGLFQIGE